MKKVYPLLLFLFGLNIAGFSQVAINEVVTTSSGTGAFLDEDGDSSDWIELHNQSEHAVDLHNWSITDDPTDTTKWLLPAIMLQPNDFLIVFASGKDRKEGPYLHTSFRLGAGREPVLLFDASGQKIDEVLATCIPTNYSFGSQPDGSSIRVHFTRPTPGSTNNQSQGVTIVSGRDTVVFSHQGGFYTQPFTLQMTVNSPQTLLYYTIDGSEPDENALLYTQPIEIKSRRGEANVFSDIETAVSWRPPQGEVFKATVIRAVAYINGCPASEVFTHTYFVDEDMKERYRFPVVSLSTDRSNFFGKKNGIYVIGHNDGLGENFFQSGKEWERPIYLEFYNPDGQLAFSQGLGARIHGRGSRSNPQKSIRLYARDEYGPDRMNYRFFPDLDLHSFKTLILRGTQSDFSSSMFRDEFIQTLIRDMNLDLQAARPVIVFINGEYWGIHNLRERQDKHYIASHHGNDPEQLDMLGQNLSFNEIIEGDEQQYSTLLHYVETHDLANSESYAYVASQVDMDNFIDYQIAQLFLANFDWPSNNVRYWRPRRADGKWRWLFFDCDACMIRESYNYLTTFTAKEPIDDKFVRATMLLRNLLKNPDFRSLFLQRFMYHLNTTFEPGRVIRLLDEFGKAYAWAVPEHSMRWNEPETYAHWMEGLNELKSFALQRPVEMMTQLNSLYEIPITLYPNPGRDEVRVKIDLIEGIAVSVKINNIQGQQVFAQTYYGSAQLNEAVINVRQMPPGLYLVQVQYGNLVFNKKLIVSR